MRQIVSGFISKLSSKLSALGPQILAQQSLAPAPAAATPDSGAVDVGVLPVVAAVALLVAILWSAVTLYDRSRKREEESVALQARITDALMTERSLSGFPLTPTVQMPLWGRGPVEVELTGSLPRPALRQTAVDLVLREVEMTGRTCSLQDRIVFTTSRLGRAA